MLPRGDAARARAGRESASTATRRAVVGALAVAGVAASALFAVHAGAAPGAYVGKAQVVVYPPPGFTVENPLANDSENAVLFAGLITEVATDGVHMPRVTNQNLTLADQGMRHDTLISLVNLGGQWADDFSRPFIRIEAVDSTPEAVRHRIRDGVAQVNSAMDTLQRRAGVGAQQRATSETVPAVPQIWYEGTHRRQAMLVSLLLGLTITVQVCRMAAHRLARTPPQLSIGTRAPVPEVLLAQPRGAPGETWEVARLAHSHAIRERQRSATLPSDRRESHDN